MDIPKKRGRGRPKTKNTPVDVVSGWARQKIAESEVDRQIDKLMKIMELKMMENSLKIPSPPPIEKEEEKGDFLHLKGRMGSNNYDINITTMEDQRMAASLLNQFGIYLIRKDH